MNKIALITGISGQDGSYLAEYLLEQGYEVHGIVRRHSVAENQSDRLNHIVDDIQTYYGDMLDEISMVRLLKRIKPTHVFNLAAMSHVKVSWNIPAFTLKTNAVGVINLLESVLLENPDIRFYQASSSEMFGNNIEQDGYQRLTTPMRPTSPYGCSKLLSYNLVQHYRNAYKLHASNGILFNHESPRRGSNFVTNKVCKAVAEIYRNERKVLELGNLDSHRDWGHAYDYVKAMVMITNHEFADDWIVATGETHSVKDLCEVAFSRVNLNYKDYVVQNEKYIRPEELDYLKGDSSKTREVLNWKPTYTFESMIHEMVDYWLSTK